MARYVFKILQLAFLILITLSTSASASPSPKQLRAFNDDIIIILGLAYYCLKKITRKPKAAPRFRINHYLKSRKLNGRFVRDFEDMRKVPAIFKENFHVTAVQFDFLLELIEKKMLPKSNTRPRDAITPKERLCITLEFLASGSLQRHIASVYRISKQHIGTIIEDTCNVIYHTLKKDYMKPPNCQEWTNISNRFNSRWNFPNCLGAIDGKHVDLKCPENAGSLFYNHKGFHSIVLMALADAEYKFIYIDIGAYGSEGDSSVFAGCGFGKALFKKQLKLPNDKVVYGRAIPHVFLADDAFPLHKHIMKPFKPSKGNSLKSEERIFNYRLSRARRCVENAFGVLCAKWVVLRRTMFLNPERAQIIVGACCMLHNFLLSEFGDDYSPPGFTDSYDTDGNLVEGNWRSCIPENSLFKTNLSRQISGRPPSSAKSIRSRFTSYFNSKSGSLNWQNQIM